MNEHNEHDELRDAPGLMDLRRSDPFVVPEGFFEQFPHRVQQHVVRSEQKSVWRTPFVKWTWYGASAMAVLALGILFLRTDKPVELNDGGHGIIGSNVEPEELDIDTWDQQELYAGLGDDHSTVVLTELGNDELAAYIEQEELPMDLILEEL